ncbi:MAG: CDP-diacylglycerol--glycerol-3-phosphate 3-phosphatidyltransferase [Leptospiraceae bacterium]|nr:MAG: CDP-diacylglycerol--glycerol-3-phosphate 3-phosphatidyltransferase [Leptospiraceae bacterium]
MKEKFNIPNIITYLRVASVPIFIYLIISPNQNHRIIAFIIFTIASLTDLIDGYIARKLNQETEFGKFLDPLADKFLVIGALITFLFLTEQVEIWMVLCIIGRDILITMLRSLAIRKGTSLKTSMFGKVKTAFQMFSIIVILLSFLAITYKQRNMINEIYIQKKEQGYHTFQIANDFFIQFINGQYQDLLFILSSFVPYYLMLITTIITIISGLRYLISNYTLLLPPYKKGVKQ